MNLKDLLITVCEALDAAKVPHALIGGMALGALGVNRSTKDVDLLVLGSAREKAKSALVAVGFRVWLETSEVIQFEGPGCVDILLANRPPTQLMIQNATSRSTLPVRCVGAEDIIGLKIQAYVNDASRALRDKADIQALIETQSELNWEKIKSYAEVFNQWEQILKLRNQVLRNR